MKIVLLSATLVAASLMITGPVAAQNANKATESNTTGLSSADKEHMQWVPEPRVFSDGEAAVTQDTSMGSIKGCTIPLMVGQPGRDRPWTKSCVWSGSTV